MLTQESTMSLAFLPLFLILLFVSIEGCTRGCYEWCPRDYCFMSGNATTGLSAPNLDILDAAAYCQYLGCSLPGFLNQAEFDDFKSYRACANLTRYIGGTSVWLDYRKVSGSWQLDPSNPRVTSTYMPQFASGQPNNGATELYTFIYTTDSSGIHDIFSGFSGTAAVCMCTVCPYICDLPGGAATPRLGYDQFPFRPGSWVDFSCNYGYYLTGAKSSQCIQGNSAWNLTWSNSSPNCSLVYCSSIFPSNSLTGYINDTVFSALSGNYTFHCYPNYIHLGQNSTTSMYRCIQHNSSMTTGYWNPSSFSECTITCDVLVPPNNGSVENGTGYNPIGRPPAGSQAVYSCNPGFNLLGVTIVSCLSNGSWSDIPPICQPNCSLTSWTPWSECSVACGGGVQFRTRNITEPGTCWNLTENQTCGTDKCVIRVVIIVIQNIGCSILLGLIGATFLLNLILRVSHLERMIHACEEVTLFVAHIFILSFRNRVDDTLLCTVTAAVIQYCILSCFFFFLLEAIQMYSYVTSVEDTKNFLPVWLNLLVGFGSPALITAPMVALYHREYPAAISCWLNWGSIIAFSSLIPIITLSCISIILIEAAGMGIFIPLISRNNLKYSANVFNHRGLIFVLASCVTHWYIGFSAIYYGNVALYGGVLITFTVLGVMIFIHHCLCHHAVHVWLYKLYRKLCCKHGRMPDWTTNNTKHIKGYEGLKKFFSVQRKPELPEEILPLPTTNPPTLECVSSGQQLILMVRKPPPLPKRPTWDEVWLAEEELFGGK